MTLADRATIANMAPEYGATMGFFPVDAETLRLSAPAPAATEAQVDLVEALHARSRVCSAPTKRPIPNYTDMLELDLGTVEPSLAGPKRPQDRVPLRDVKAVVRSGAASAASTSAASA